MGVPKKSSNKCQPPQGPSTVSEESACIEAPAQPVENRWLESLTPEERALEDGRQQARQKKAEVAKQQQELEQRRRAQEESGRQRAARQEARQEARQDKERQELMSRAKGEGMLESQKHADGNWYVDLGSGLSKQVEHYFWCRHCDSGMSEAAIISHIEGAPHRRKTGAIGHTYPATIATSTASWLAPPVRDRRLVAHSGCLEKWQAADTDGQVRCVPCNKYCDGLHEATSEHEKRIWAFAVTLEGNYKEPEEEWLAWMACEEWGEGLYLKCLLCDKWIQDLAGTDPRGYDGHHSRLSSNNQKGHLKKMQNLDYHMKDHSLWNAMLAERSKWHPPARSDVASQMVPEKSPSPALQEGWRATWSEEYKEYYFHSDYHEAQWEVPTAPAAGTSAL